MLIHVFLSTGLQGETEESMKWHRHWAENYLRNEIEVIRDDDEIEVVDNFIVENRNCYASSREKKLLNYSRALSEMSYCDFFVLLKEYDGSIKSGCMLELNAWFCAGGVQPIIREKIQYKEGWDK